MKAFIGTVAAACLVIGVVMAARSSAQAPKKIGDVTEERVIAETAIGNKWLVDGGTFGQPVLSQCSANPVDHAARS
jgi:hypothetical protein